MKFSQNQSIRFAVIGGLLLIPVASAGFWWTGSYQVRLINPNNDTVTARGWGFFSIGDLPDEISVAQLPKQGNVFQDSPSLSPIHPDEPVDDTLNERFSLSNSLERIQQIKNALSSFQQLTETSQPILGDRKIAEIGHTDWETQHLGFPNWVDSVEGTLKKQAYQIAKLEFELAQEQYQYGEISQAVLSQKEANYRRAEQDFQEFWNSLNIAD